MPGSLRFLSITSTALALCGSCFVVAAPKFDASLDVTETYTDNIFLQADKEGSFITEVSPSVSLSDSGAKTDYSLRLRHRYIDYQETDLADRRENSGFASLNRYELDRSLRFFANSSITNIDLQQSILFGDTTRDDRVETISHSLGAAYDSQRRLHHDISYDLQYLRTRTDDSQVDTEVYDGNVRLANGTRHRIPFWEISSGFTEQQGNTKDTQVVHNAIVGINLTKEIGLFVTGNREEIRQQDRADIISEFWGVGARVRRNRLEASVAYNRTEEGENEQFISAAIDWQPTSRTQINLDYSKRFFGETYGGSISHRTRKISQSLRIADRVTSFSQNIGANDTLLCRIDQSGFIDFSSCRPASEVTDPTADLVPIGNLIFNDIDEEQRLNRSVIYSFSYNRAKSTFTISGIWNRTKLLSEALESQEYVVQRSGIFSWDWNITSKLSMRLTSRIEDLDEREGSDDSTSYAQTISLSNNATEHLTTTLSYSYLSRKFEEDNDFNENQISLSLNARL